MHTPGEILLRLIREVRAQAERLKAIDCTLQGEILEAQADRAERELMRLISGGYRRARQLPLDAPADLFGARGGE